jgi:hypothetical protein
LPPCRGAQEEEEEEEEEEIPLFLNIHLVNKLMPTNGCECPDAYVFSKRCEEPNAYFCNLIFTSESEFLALLTDFPIQTRRSPFLRRDGLLGRAYFLYSISLSKEKHILN